MRTLKSYKQFYEDATCDVSNTSGMGTVVSSQPGTLPGDTGTIGSGDIGIVYDNKSKRRKKGGPSQVSDLRDLKPVKTNKIEESLEVSISEDDKEKINNCLVELFDEYFTLEDISYLDDIKKGATRSENTNNILSIELYKYFKIRDNDTDDLLITIKFDKIDGFYPPKIYKTSGLSSKELPELSEYDKKVIELSEDSTNKIINTINYDYGEILIQNTAHQGGNEIYLTINLKKH
jgi:hypothetical protein